MCEWSETWEDVSHSGDCKEEKLVIGDLLFMVGEREKEVKLAIKVSNLRNRYGNMKPYTGG